MNKFILKGCYNLVSSFYADGCTANNECGVSVLDEKCANVKGCPFKQVAENLLKVVNEDLCNNCDGCGYGNGCLDEGCGTYEAHKCLDLLQIEFVEE